MPPLQRVLVALLLLPLPVVTLVALLLWRFLVSASVSVLQLVSLILREYGDLYLAPICLDNFCLELYYLLEQLKFRPLFHVTPLCYRFPPKTRIRLQEKFMWLTIVTFFPLWCTCFYRFSCWQLMVAKINHLKLIIYP